MPNASRLIVGYIAGAHGIHGLVRVQLHDASSRAVRPGAELVLVGDGRERGQHRVETVDPIPGKPGRLRVRLEGIMHREQAEALKSLSVEVDREALPPLGDDEFYLADAIGLPVYRSSSDGRLEDLGRVVSLSSNGPQDLFEVEWREASGAAHRWLLPVLPQFVRDVDADRILVEVPAGFLPEALEPE